MKFFQSPRQTMICPATLFSVSGHCIAAVALALLSGCVALPKPEVDLATFSDNYPLANAEIMPPKHHRVKVLMLDIKNSNNDMLRSIKGSDILSGKLKTVIDSMGAERIDRSIEEALRDELARCEAFARSCFSSEIPDLVLSGEFTDVEVDSSFNEKGVDLINALRDKTPENDRDGTCTKSVKVYGTLRIRALNGMVLKDTVILEGKAEKDVPTKKRNCSFDRGRDGPELVEKAIRDSISYADKENIKAQLAPRGYVKTAQGNPAEAAGSLVHTSMPLGQHVEAGNTVVFYRQFKDSGKYADHNAVSLKEIAAGKIVNIKHSKRAWVKVDDSDKAKALQVGDIAQVVYRSWCDGNIQRKLCGD